MRAMRAVLVMLLVIALFGLAGSFVIESGYTARSQKVQIVRIDHTAKNPFGPVTIDVGDPVDMILDDQGAFLKNKTPLGLPMVDADYLKQHEGAIVRIEHIQSLAALARFGCAASALIAVLGLGLLKRLQFPLFPPDPPQ